MKKYLLAVAIIAVGFTSCKKEKKANDVKVEKTVETVTEPKTTVNPLSKGTHKTTVITEKSFIEWIGSKPTEAHNGTIKLSSGTLDVVDGKIFGGSFVIDMNTINNLDEKPGKGKEKLENHLKNGDFFDVAKYPTAKFEITKVSEEEQGSLVTGNMTIKDKTKELSFSAKIKPTENGFIFVSDQFKFNRLDFNVTYASKTLNAALKDKFINDEIELTISLETTK